MSDIETKYYTTLTANDNCNNQPKLVHSWLMLLLFVILACKRQGFSSGGLLENGVSFSIFRLSNNA